MHNVNYFNVILVGDKNYEVVQTPHKNKIFRKKSALTNLKNIEKVLTQNLVLKGENSTSSHENKLSALRMISQYITDNYSAKVSKLNWLSRKLFSKEKQVQALNKKIRETINHLATPPSFDKVPVEVTNLIANFLDDNALKKLTQASKVLNDQVGYALLRKRKDMASREMMLKKPKISLKLLKNSSILLSKKPL